MTELKYKIGIVEYDFNDVIDEWINEESRDEAKEIVSNILKWNNLKCTHTILEWIVYIERKMGNQICMHLDYMKYELVKAGIMPLTGKFGQPFTSELEEHLDDDFYFDYKQFFKDINK
jgi:hypothetical protein